MPRIGVFGLMASGKSTVSRWFRDWGATLVDGDVLGWEALRDPGVVRGLVEAFGPGVLDAEGAVDRAQLGPRVFRDPDAMRRLNEIVQPVLVKHVRKALGGPFEGVLVLDAAMLTAWGLERELDGIVEVRAAEETRARRLEAARGFTRAEALERVRGQRLPPVTGARRHWVVENDGGRDALRRRAEAVWKEIAALA